MSTGRLASPGLSADRRLAGLSISRGNGYRPWHGLGRAVLVLAVVCSCLAPAVAGAVTFGLQPQVYCPSANHPCSYPDEEALAENILRNIAEMNVIYKVTGISFQPKPPIFHYGTPYTNITANVGLSNDKQTPNDTLVQQLLDTVAAPDPSEITLFLIPGLKLCWQSGITPGSDKDLALFCVPENSQGNAYAHELGHYFCLAHTQSFDDTANAAPNPPQDADVAWVVNGVNVLDTPNDPGPLEFYDYTLVANGKDGNLDANGKLLSDWDAANHGVPLHDYCTSNYHDGTNPGDIGPDAGSPHVGYCDGTCWSYDANGQELANPAFAPIIYDVMSYYHCPGPFVLNGIRHEAFTPGQVKMINACWKTPLNPNRANLVDVCKGRGGDTDNDGLCNVDDNCPKVPNNTPDRFKDTDLDGVPDDCDNCMVTQNPDQADKDGDGMGDVCDGDRDGDGCANWEDQHPDDSLVPIGTWVSATCAEHSGVEYGWEGRNSDGDGLADCQDLDDDNDGIPDDQDPCPTIVGANCTSVQDCGGAPWQDLCARGGCNDILLVVVDAVNPDPTTTLQVDHVEIVKDHLYLYPPVGLTPSETARGIVGPVPTGGVVGRAVTAPARRQVQLWSKASGALLAIVADFDPASIALGDLRHGNLVVLAPPHGETTTLDVAMVWSVGATRDSTLPDGDGDGVPDTVDDCVAVANAAQLDTDHDGFGDACDADLDGDGLVTGSDLRLVKKCRGYEVGKDHAKLDGAGPSGDGPISAREQFAALRPSYRLKLERQHVAQRDCAKADLNGDRIVDARDAVLVRAAIGTTPGPSGLAN